MHKPCNPHRQRLLNAEVRQAAAPKAKGKARAKPKGKAQPKAKAKGKAKAAPAPKPKGQAKGKAKARAAPSDAEQKRQHYMCAKYEYFEQRLASESFCFLKKLLRCKAEEDPPGHPAQ